MIEPVTGSKVHKARVSDLIGKVILNQCATVRRWAMFEVSRSDGLLHLRVATKEEIQSSSNALIRDGSSVLKTP
jgi:hypothetical protein